jgi:hypothetical protein
MASLDQQTTAQIGIESQMDGPNIQLSTLLPLTVQTFSLVFVSLQTRLPVAFTAQRIMDKPGLQQIPGYLSKVKERPL